MKTLIVYYSLTGANETAASALKEILGCEIEKIFEPKNRHGFFMFFKNGFDAITKKLTNIEDFKVDLGSFDRVILFTPIWAGRLPPATRTFLVKYGDKIKNLEVVSVSGFGSKNKELLNDVNKTINRKIQNILFITEKELKEGSFKMILEEYFKNI